MNYGLENFNYHSISEVKPEKECYLPVRVAKGQTEYLGETSYVPVEVGKTVELRSCEGVLLRENEQIQVICKRENLLDAPVSIGDEVGSISYLVGDEVYRIEYLTAACDVPVIDLVWCVKQVMKKYVRL